MSIHLINTAYAAGAPGSAGAQPHMSFGPILIMIIVFIAVSYFMVWGPQNKKAKEHRKLLDNLSKGDEVITNGGIMGKISKLNDNVVVLQIADSVDIQIQKSCIATVLPKGSLKTV